MGTVINTRMYAHSMWKYARLKAISALLLGNTSRWDSDPEKKKKSPFSLKKLEQSSAIIYQNVWDKSGVNFKETTLLHFLC